MEVMQVLVLFNVTSIRQEVPRSERSYTSVSATIMGKRELFC